MLFDAVSLNGIPIVVKNDFFGGNLFTPLRGSSILKCQSPRPTKITMPANAVHQAAHVFMKNTVLIETWICTLTDAPGARKLSKLITGSLRSNPFLRFVILRILGFQIGIPIRNLERLETKKSK